MRIANWAAATLFIVCLAHVSSAAAQTLREPTGRVILMVTGSIEHRNTAEGAAFDYAMLEQLGLVEQQIDTPWTDAGSVFEGVMARQLLETVGASGTNIRAGAANDYRIDIPYSDLVDYDTMIGVALDGKRLTLRDKGPLWLLYSNDNHPPVAVSELHARMIWQLTTLLVE